MNVLEARDEIELFANLIQLNKWLWVWGFTNQNPSSAFDLKYIWIIIRLGEYQNKPLVLRFFEIAHEITMDLRSVKGQQKSIAVAESLIR